MGVDPNLYFGAVEEVLGPVRLRDLGDYDHVTDSGILAQILTDNAISDAGELVARVKAVFMDELNSHIRATRSFPIIDGAVQFVERVRRAADLRIAIATGCWRDSALLKLRSAGFNIEGIPLVTSDDSPSRTDIMRLALQMTGNGAGAVTYFGDAEWDRRACQDLGWEFIAVGQQLGGISSFSGILL